MKKYWSQSLTLLVAGLVTLQVSAQERHAFSAQQAVAYALKNAVQIKNALVDYKIQEQTNREITASAFPQVNGSLAINDFLKIPTSLIPAEFTGGPPGTYIPIKFGTKYSATAGLDINQLLFDGQVFVGLQARHSALEFYNRQTEVTSEMIKANVMKVYYQLVIGREQLTSIDANITRFDKLLADTKEIYKNGFAEKLDVDKVSVQLNNLKTEKIKVDNQLDAGLAGLKYLMHMPQKAKLILMDSVTEEELKLNLLDTAYQYTNRKEYQLLQVAQKLGEYNIKRYQLSYLPTLSLFGNFSQNAQRKEFTFLKTGSQYPWFPTALIGLKLNVPIFDGFARSARISKARLELEKTQNNMSQLEATIDNDVEQARLKITSALLTIDNQRRNMQLAEQVYNTTKLKYEQGLGSNQEIYNAQAELKVAQNNYYSALIDAVIFKIDYQKAIGTL
ncbi:MAG: TolC family protein [Ferruginibacter sp.]